MCFNVWLVLNFLISQIADVCTEFYCVGLIKHCVLMIYQLVKSSFYHVNISCLVPCSVLTDVLSNSVAFSWGVQPAGGPNKPGTYWHCPLVQGPSLSTEERWNPGLDGRFPEPKPHWAAENRPGAEWEQSWESPECFLGSQSCKRYILNSVF